MKKEKSNGTQIKRIKQIKTDLISENLSDLPDRQAGQHHPRSIPPDWSWVKLGDVGIVASGGTPPTKVKEYFEGKIPWITPADLTDYTDKYISRGRRNISEIGLKNSSAKLVPKGSILFSSRAPIGYVVIASNDIATNQGFKNLIPNVTVTPEFVYYYLKASKQLAERNASGTTFKEISAKSFANLPIPLPPLPVQHKIVEKIEELFSELDSGVANLRKAKEQIKTYRQSVLAYSFSGRLIKNEELIIKNLSAVHLEDEKSSSNSSLFTIHSSLPKGWKWVKLGKVCSKIQDGSHFSPKKQYSQKSKDRYLYLTSKNIRNNYLDLSDITYIEREFHNSIYYRCNPEYGDVLLTKDGANTGNVTINSLTEEFSLLSSVCLLKPKKENLTSEFLKYYLQSPIGSKKITGAMTGTAIKRIILRTIKEAEIILPSLDTQHQIVSEIERRFSVADKLEQTIDESLKKAEQLKQSILKKAFEGKLIKNEIEEEKEKELTPFQLMQIVGAIINNLEEYNIHKGEMIIAKYLYLLQKLYGIRIGLKYGRWHFGPYAPKLKKLLTSPQGFFQQVGKGTKSYYAIKKKEQLFKYRNNLVAEVNEHFPKLIELFSKAKDSAKRDHKIELLATVSKIIEDFETLDHDSVYERMSEWETNKEITGYCNKAEKFSKDETMNCIEFIKKKEWDKILLQQETVE